MIIEVTFQKPNKTVIVIVIFIWWSPFDIIDLRTIDWIVPNILIIYNTFFKINHFKNDFIKIIK